jgi:hypothetical protein
MTEPLTSGTLTGYDVVNSNPAFGPRSLDGQLDTLHYRINDDDTASVYMTMPDGTAFVVADQIEWMERDGEDYGVLHFQADKDLMINGALVPGDGQPEQVTLMWRRNVKGGSVRVDTFFDEGSRQFDTLLAAHPDLKADFTRALAKKYSYSSSAWTNAQDLNDDGLCDIANVEVVHYGTFVLPTTDTPYGYDHTDPNRDCNARVDVLFTGSHAP